MIRRRSWSTARALTRPGFSAHAGMVRSTRELLSETAVSVLPSVEGEGLPNSILEAMAASVPVVATNVGGNAEAVEDGVTGLLVPPRDAHALARGICQFLEDGELASRFAQAGRRRVVEYFSLARMVREMEGLYQGLVTEAMAGRLPGVGTPYAV